MNVFIDFKIKKYFDTKISYDRFVLNFNIPGL